MTITFVKLITDQPDTELLNMAQLQTVDGTLLDYNNISEADLKVLLNAASKVKFTNGFNKDELNTFINQFLVNTYRFTPNIIYVPRTFVESINTDAKIIKRADLFNKLVLVYADNMYFPAYKKVNNKIDVVNSCFLLVVEF